MDDYNIAEVMPLGIHLGYGFYYLIPSHLRDKVDLGKRVKISFRNKKRVGIIIDIVQKIDLPELKEIIEILDPIPILTKGMLDLIEWIAHYYLCPKGTIIDYIVPSQVSAKKVNSYFEKNSIKYKITEKNEPFIARNEVNISTPPLKKNYQATLFNNLMLTKEVISTKPILFQYNNYRTRDLYYYRWIMKTVEEGKQVLILIPEQFCGTQLKKKILKKLGEAFGIFDKKASQTQKYLRFIKVLQGEVKVVIGTRSNVFLPFKDLGLIIVEEENSTLYKEERAPRYHAREVALARGRLEPCPVILGSYAPTVESYWQSVNKNYLLKTEKHSLSGNKRNFPMVDIINLEEEKSFPRVISFQLQQQMVKFLKERKGIALFLNRRGFASYISCLQCGYVMKCPSCNSLLSYHREGEIGWMACHVCGKKLQMVKYCPRCKKEMLKQMGYGTQYVEDIVRKMFPRATIQRFDIDVAPNMKIQKQLINKFKRGEINILIGTQLLFRKLSYRQVGLVGFILVDHLFNIPNYRSSEEAFQFMYQIVLNLLAQKEPKELLIQTCQPEHHSLLALKQLSYPLFYQKEITLREELAYPPFSKMIRIDHIGQSKEAVKKSAVGFIDYVNQSGLLKTLEMDFPLNNSNLIIDKEKSNYKVSFLLKINSQIKNLEQVKEKLSLYILKNKTPKVKLRIDVEPIK